MRTVLAFAVVVSTVFFLSRGEQARAFTTTGETLDTSQRDYRVWNSFADSKANNNVIADPDFPGALGAVQAIRKAAAEWGSRLHGASSLGSGGANFDYWYAGETDALFSSDDNVISALTAGGGGVLAFTQGPTADGWTIQFFDGAIIWSDGPGAVGAFDIQSVACHELGHALGLGDSSVVGSTMESTISAGDTGARTLGPDDIAGVQSIYGVAAGAKPVITDVAMSSGIATITGTGFSPSGNQVWFTDRFPATGGGIQVANVNSTNGGTEIVIGVPTGAGNGDVIVKNASSGGSSLSNTWPVYVEGPVFYCQAKPSSDQCLAALSTSDLDSSPVSGANDYQVIAFRVESFKNGLFFGSLSGRAAIPFNGGTLCMNPPLFRTPVQNSGGSIFCTGQIGITVNTGVQVPSGPDAGAGNASWMQLWYRDTANGPGNFGTALSNAVELTFQ